MANQKNVKRSQEEILTLTAQNVAETITPRPTEFVLETFQKYFKQKAFEMLEVKKLCF